MGRSFVAPPGKSPKGYHDVYVNIGSGLKSCLMFPPYLPILELACNAAQYDGLMEALKNKMKADAMDPCAVQCALLLAFGTFCICSCPFCVVKMNEHALQGDVMNIIEQTTKGHGWGGGVKLKIQYSANQAPETMDVCGVDQHGQLCRGTIAKSLEAAVWPPLWYNVVISVPDPNGDFRARWLQMARGGGVGVVQAQVVGAPAQNVMASPEDRLAKLQDLKDKGMINEGEYAKKRLQLISDI